MKCKQCGFKNGKDKNFCTNCGAALKKEKTELSKKQIITIAVSGAAVFAVICAAVFLPRKKGANRQTLRKIRRFPKAALMKYGLKRQRRNPRCGRQAAK